MRFLRSRSSRLIAFTLIELMISVTLAMTMSTMALLAFFKVRNLVTRAESRLAMHYNAQILFTTLRRKLSSTMQHCAIVTESTATTPNAIPATGTVILVFMHGKEDTDDFNWQGGAFPYNNTWTSDLLWDELVWKESTHTLYAASSTPLRNFSVAQSYVPLGGSALGTGTAVWQQEAFMTLPQPRRWLNPTHPDYTLDNNMLFPTDSTSATSGGGPGDVGDWEDLQNNLKPFQDNILSFSMQLVFHDGVDAPPMMVDDTTSNITVFPGVYMDGRMPAAPKPIYQTPSWLVPAGLYPNGLFEWPSGVPNASPPSMPDLSLIAPQATPAEFGSTAIANRPRLIRIRCTMFDPKTSKISNTLISNAMKAGDTSLVASLTAAQQATALTQTFSFSFPLPGMSPPP